MDLEQDHRTRRPLPPLSRRRDKPQSVCNFCRKGKLRCDRAQPCGNCVQRGRADACAYVASASTPNRSVASIPPSSDLTDRVHQLENLVRSMIANPVSRAPTDPITPEGRSRQRSPQVDTVGYGTEPVQPESSIPVLEGVLNVQNGSTSYVESTHWIAILDQISEVKQAISNIGATSERYLFPSVVLNPDQADVIFGGYPRLNKQQLISNIPLRSTVDLLVNEYFNNKSIDSMIIHKPTFLAEYSHFWERPTGTGSNITFIALLFAITRLAAAHFTQPLPLLPDPKLLVQSHRTFTIQALVLAKYTTCPPLAIETLIILYQADTLQKEDTEIDTSLLLSIIVRLAFRAGLHRDPSHFPRIRALEGELRRRVWALIMQLDKVAALQTGLPRILRKEHYDTTNPGFFLDTDLRAEDEVLPSPRPENSSMSIEFLVTKNSLLDAYGIITDLGAVQYEDIITAEVTLRDADKAISQHLRLAYTESSEVTFQDPPDLTIKQIYLSLLFDEARCILHQRFLHFNSRWTSTENRQWSISRTIAQAGALRLLDHQHLLEIETRPGGRLYQERWRIDRGARNAFLIACAVLCYSLEHYSLERGQLEGPEKMKHKVIAALQKSLQIWIEIEGNSSSLDATRARKAIEVVLAHAASREPGHESPSVNLNTNPTTSNIQDERAASTQNHNPGTTATAATKGGFASIHHLLVSNNDHGVDYTGISPWSNAGFGGEYGAAFGGGFGAAFGPGAGGGAGSGG